MKGGKRGREERQRAREEMTEEEEENVFFLRVSVSFFRVILPPPKISTFLIPRLSLSLFACLVSSPGRLDES